MNYIFKIALGTMLGLIASGFLTMFILGTIVLMTDEGKDVEKVETVIEEKCN